MGQKRKKLALPILTPDYTSNQQFYLKGRFKKSFCIHDDAYYGKNI